MPNRLLIDTACSHASLLYSHGDQVFTHTAIRPDRGHDRFIFQTLEKILQQNPSAWASLEDIGVCIGPGRFNGVRVACSIIATFMSILKKSAYVCNSFELLQAADLSPSITGYAIFAKRGYAYYQEKGGLKSDLLVPFIKLPYSTHVLEIEGHYQQQSFFLDLTNMDTLISEGRARSIQRPVDLEPLYCALI
jgi:tRNA threonylcarbamoyl adenosine modification protein YeaZ